MHTAGGEVVMSGVDGGVAQSQLLRGVIGKGVLG